MAFSFANLGGGAGAGATGGGAAQVVQGSDLELIQTEVCELDDFSL